MPRATSVIAASHRHDRPVADTVILDYAMRSAGEGVVTSVKGNTIEIHLHGGLRLRTDDLLVLDDGTLVEVLAPHLASGLKRIDAPFEPEGGAYAPPPAQAHDHVHDAHCGHDHCHDHAHDHGHDHHHDHAHSHHGHKHD